MRTEFIREIREEKKEYKAKLKCFDHKDLSAGMDSLWKDIRTSEWMDDSWEESMEESTKYTVSYIGLYAALEDRLGERTFSDKMLHPIRTGKENRILSGLKDVLKARGIPGEVLTDYFREDPADEILKQPSEIIRIRTKIDLDEEIPSFEPFITYKNTQAGSLLHVFEQAEQK